MAAPAATSSMLLAVPRFGGIAVGAGGDVSGCVLAIGWVTLATAVPAAPAAAAPLMISEPAGPANCTGGSCCRPNERPDDPAATCRMKRSARAAACAAFAAVSESSCPTIVAKGDC